MAGKTKKCQQVQGLVRALFPACRQQPSHCASGREQAGSSLSLPYTNPITGLCLTKRKEEKKKGSPFDPSLETFTLQSITFPCPSELLWTEGKPQGLFITVSQEVFIYSIESKTNPSMMTVKTMKGQGVPIVAQWKRI